MEDNNYIISNSNGVRSTFLTIVCVLTFLGSGWGVLSCIRGYFRADIVSEQAAASLDRAQDKIDNPNTPNFVKELISSAAQSANPESIRLSSVLQFISCLLTLTGAIMMFTLRKVGFYLYIAGIMLSIGAPLITGKGLVAIIGASVYALIGVIFIAMYGANLSDMKK
jgi:hypothetical protein